MTTLEQKRRKDLSRIIAVSFGASVAFLIGIQLLGRLISGRPEDPAMRWLVPLPGVVLAAVAVAAMRSLRRMDELERRMHSEAMPFAYLCSLLFIATYTFVKVAGLPTPPVGFLLPTMVSCWVVGLLLAVQRYR